MGQMDINVDASLSASRRTSVLPTTYPVLWSTYSPAPCKDCLESSPPSLDMALPPAHLPSALNPVSRFREMRNQAEIFPASCYQTKLLSTPTSFFLLLTKKSTFSYYLPSDTLINWVSNPFIFLGLLYAPSAKFCVEKILYIFFYLVHFSLDLFLGSWFFLGFFFFSSSVSLLNIVNIQNIVITTLSMSLCANSNIWLSSGFVSIDGLNLLTMGPVYLILCMRPCLELFFPLPNDLW